MKSQKTLSVSQNSLYNMIGTTIYCICQWITSAVIVIRLSPEATAAQNAGILQLAISVTNIFNAIALYSMRTYQISDMKNKFSNGDYIGARFVTAAIACAGCMIYAFASGYTLQKCMSIIFYMIYKLSEIFCDVLHGIDQKNSRMDYVGISYVLRGIVSVLAFGAALFVTDSIITAILAMAVASLLVVVVYDCKCTLTFGSIKPSFKKSAIASLLLACLPAVISTASFNAIVSIPRQTLEGTYGEASLGYYATIATPLVVVQVLATSIFNPMLTELAKLYNDGKIKDFVRRLLKNIMILAAISLFVCLCVALFGDFAIGVVFGSAFVPYTYLMYGIVACTSLYVVSWLCTNTLIVMRKLNVCMIAGLCALVISISLSVPFIKNFSLNGVSYCVIVSYIIHILICVAVIARLLLNCKNVNNFKGD